jgi:hypothetical protein
MSNIRNINNARRDRELKKFADIILEDLGNSAEEIALIADAAPDDIRNGIIEALERKEMWDALKEIKAQEDEAEGKPADTCHNMVCPKFQQSEFRNETIEDTGFTYYKFSGKSNYCTDGAMCAQGCIFRMSEQPPSDPFDRIPSHAEAVRMLQREGLLQPDEFGHWNGTDFIFHKNIKKLWEAYINLLVETGKIDKAIFILEDGTEKQDFGEMQKQAKKELLK